MGSSPGLNPEQSHSQTLPFTSIVQHSPCLLHIQVFFINSLNQSTFFLVDPLETSYALPLQYPHSNPTSLHSFYGQTTGE